jgi:hypothetical protein
MVFAKRNSAGQDVGFLALTDAKTLAPCPGRRRRGTWLDLRLRGCTSESRQARKNTTRAGKHKEGLESKKVRPRWHRVQCVARGMFVIR